MEVGGGEPLLQQNGLFTEKRQPKDQVWGFLFIFSIIGSLALGSYAFLNRDEDFLVHAQIPYLEDPANCYSQIIMPSLVPSDNQVEEDIAQQSLQYIAALSLTTVVASVVLGIIILALANACASCMIYTVITTYICVLILCGIQALLLGSLAGALSPFLLACVVLTLALRFREKLKLCSKLLAQSADAMKALPSLIPMHIIVNVFVLVIPSLILLACIALAITNGHVGINPQVVGTPQGSIQPKCYDSDRNEVLCCMYIPDPWVIPCVAFVGVVLTWLAFLSNQIKIYLTGGSVLFWYSNPEAARRRSPVLLSTRHALTTSFGSLCCSSAILTALKIIRDYLNQAQQNAQNEASAALIALLRCCYECCAQIIEILTKFSTIYMAGSGQSFFDAAKDTTQLLRRNLLSTVTVWWIPNAVLSMWSFLLALIWGAAATWYGMQYASHLSADENIRLLFIVVGVLQGVIALVIISFFVQTILAVVDALYIAYAFDKDYGCVGNADMHAVFTQLPSAHIVENPGGDVMVAQPTGGYYQGTSMAGDAGSQDVSGMGYAPPQMYRPDGGYAGGAQGYAPPQILRPGETGEQQAYQQGGRYHYG